MELNHEPVSGPVRAAATVVMLRDAPGGLEVFLIKRHGLSDVLGGAYVFPGGKVDRQDALLDMAAHLDQPPQRLHAVLGEPELDPVAAAGIYVAALREAFEETGLLYADGAHAALATQATALLREGRAFDEMLALMQLRLNASALTPWTRWITPRVPSVMNKRFDTRFFVAAVPAGQQATHDNHEATDSVWLQPRAALEQYRDRAIELAPPQIMSLAHLSHHRSVASVLEQARSRLPPVIQPEPFELDGVRVISYPGDERHPVATRAMPGPTRLHYRDRRFEPAAGFEALFD
ncbi:NUDIX hydrolase [Caenimonas terrae]|uniref:NUDIX hydrolase n=1 Tax=Caenimonas terrae TaxID=696074 RepID=A0ABW0NG36_9BURK